MTAAQMAKKRAESQTPERRSEIARKAAAERWRKERKQMKLECTRCSETIHRITDEDDPHDEFHGVEYRPLCTKCYFEVFRKGEEKCAD